MKRPPTIATLVGSLLMAGALGVACSHQQHGSTKPPPHPLGESTATGPSDPTHQLEIPQTNAPPIENVPTLSTPTPMPVETPAPGAPPQPITTVPAPTTPAPVVAPPATPPSPGTTTPRTPAPVQPPANPPPPANPQPPAPTPPPPVTPPPTPTPAPTVPPSMLPMQVRTDAGVGAPAPVLVRDGGTILPRDASPTPPPTPRTDGGAIPITPR